LKVRAVVSFAILLIALNAAAGTPPSPWAAMAQRDLRAIHDIIRDNHPGPVDPENPRFRDWLEKGLLLASRDAAKATTYSDYVRALRLYTNGFQDGHVTLSFDLAPNQTEWTGFVVGGGTGGRLEVVYADPDAGFKVGDQIESCDGRSVDALLKERVDPYFSNSAIPHARMNYAAYLFLQNPDERDRRLTACHVASGNDVQLKWRAADTKDVNKTLFRALSGDAEFAMTSVDGVWFIRLPRFWFTSEAEMQKLSGLISDIAAKQSELRKATVVFDVRGNGGGDSLWGYRIAIALWGEDWVSRIAGSFDGTHDLRASPANVRKVMDIMALMKKNNEAEVLPYWTRVLEAMKEAQAAGRPLAHIPQPPSVPAKEAPPNPISGRVFLLTDGGCGSACLDFADLLLRLPGVTQIGLPTFADAVYIDVNDAPLPSGIARVSYGMKVFRHRVRANNEWYEPKFRWPGGPMSNEAVAKWVRTLP
jgi:hypothetical protein